MAEVSVDIRGLDELRRELRKADLTKSLGRAHKRIAQFVVDKAEDKKNALQSRFPSYKKVKLKPSAAAKAAQAIVGPKSVGSAGEFGVIVHPVYGRPRLQTRFDRAVWPGWKGSGEDAGYLVFPTVRENRDEIVDMYGDVVMEELRPAFPEGTLNA